MDAGSVAVGGPGARPSAEVIIGLDVGTTATKAVAFELGTDWRYTALREYPLSAPNRAGRSRTHGPSARR